MVSFRPVSPVGLLRPRLGQAGEEEIASEIFHVIGGGSVNAVLHEVIAGKPSSAPSAGRMGQLIQPQASQDDRSLAIALAFGAQSLMSTILLVGLKSPVAAAAGQLTAFGFLAFDLIMPSSTAPPSSILIPSIPVVTPGELPTPAILPQRTNAPAPTVVQPNIVPTRSPLPPESSPTAPTEQLPHVPMFPRLPLPSQG